MNPNVAVVNVTTTPVLLFSGVGTVRFSVVGGSGGGIYFGNSAVDNGNADTNGDFGSQVEFKRPAELWSVAVSGSYQVKVTSWD